MALVMLPCDLPWWSNVQKKLAAIENAQNLDEIVEQMLKIHDLCNVSLDPDEDSHDTTIFDGFRYFVENILTDEERKHFLDNTIKRISRRAQILKQYRPPRGLSFSLQQQSDTVELDHRFVASLLANAFFSTFPKRTEKTHPTLQDFNFTHFFRGLENNNVQKAKFRSFLYYFDWLETQEMESSQVENIKISRKVMTGKQWLTIEDWMECSLPLCDIQIKHEGKLDKSSSDTVQAVFSSARIGGDGFSTGTNQESVQLFTFPEMLAVMLYVEAIEDNESLQIDNVRHISRIIDAKGKGIFEKIEVPKKTSLICIDPEDYKDLPSHQFEEDNVLRELNKCLLSFRQNTPASDIKMPRKGPSQDRRSNHSSEHGKGRLSPIGERDREGSTPSSPADATTTFFVRQPTPSSKRESQNSDRIEKDINKRRSYLTPENQMGSMSPNLVIGPVTSSGRKGKFIVLGSSGECLPVNRRLMSQNTENTKISLYSSCDSLDQEDSEDDEEEFHSARDSLDEESDIEEDVCYRKKFSLELDTPEKRYTFAQKLKEALQSNTQFTSSTDDSSSYAVGNSISGLKTGDQNIKFRREGSGGFMLTEGSVDEDYFRLGSDDQALLNKNKEKQNGILQKKGNESSNYSFDSDMDSELEEVYEQFAKWLDDPVYVPKSGEKVRELDSRDEALLQFASSLLKRTLSESFVGVPITEDGLSNSDDSGMHEDIQKQKIILNARSLSLELAKHKHKIAAQLKKELLQLQIGLKSGKFQEIEKPTPPPRRKKEKMPKKKSLSWYISCLQSEENVKCDDVSLKISQLGQKRNYNVNLRPIGTGNWGCGRSKRGDCQLKLVIQWMAASVAELPFLVYYTNGNEKLTKLDTVCRVLLDRKWTVGELCQATLSHSRDVLDSASDYNNNINVECFFDKLLGLS